MSDDEFSVDLDWPDLEGVGAPAPTGARDDLDGAETVPAGVVSAAGERALLGELAKVRRAIADLRADLLHAGPISALDERVEQLVSRLESADGADLGDPALGEDVHALREELLERGSIDAARLGAEIERLTTEVAALNERRAAVDPAFVDAVADEVVRRLGLVLEVVDD